MRGAFASLTRQNPLASRGQAQYQIVVPPDGSEPYLLYEDHAYYNIDSQDPGEAPLLNDPAAKFVNSTILSKNIFLPEDIFCEKLI